MSIELLVLRHGLAGTPEKFQQKHPSEPDSARPLTAKGKREMKRVSRGVRALVRKLDCIVTSPYVRAYETATVLSKRYPDTSVTEMKELTPETLPELTLKA